MMANFKIQPGAAHRAGVTDRGDHITGSNPIPGGFKHFLYVRVNRVVAGPMIDNHHVAVSLKPAGIEHIAGIYGANGFTFIGFDINAAAKIGNIVFPIFIWAE